MQLCIETEKLRFPFVFHSLAEKFKTDMNFFIDILSSNLDEILYSIIGSKNINLNHIVFNFFLNVIIFLSKVDPVLKKQFKFKKYKKKCILYFMKISKKIFI